MQLIGFTLEQILAARDTCGVPGLRLESGAWRGSRPNAHGVSEYRTKTGKLRYYSCVLRVSAVDAVGPRGGRIRIPHPFARSTGRTTTKGKPRYSNGAVNWDGHFKFMAKLFEQQPDGIIRTSLLGPIEYRNEADFYFQCQKSKAVPFGPVIVQILPGGRTPTYDRITFGEL